MTQSAELARCETSLSDLIVQFYTQSMARGVRQFHASDLREFISIHTPTAPASADRILRLLRRRGLLNYRVVNRQASLYEFMGAAATV